MMKIFAMILIVLLIEKRSMAQETLDLPGPKNLTARVRSNAVALMWLPVENAANYFITLSDNQNHTTSETRVAFGGLDADTEYKATVTTVDENGITSSRFSTTTFTTLSDKVTGLKVTDVTASSIEATWDVSDFAISYTVVVTDDQGRVIEPDISVEENVAFISNLTSMTFYIIQVTPVGIASIGGTAVIRTRTDGSGVNIVALWEGSQRIVGGEAKIFRPLTIPKGPYKMRIILPCPASETRFWNANFEEKSSIVDEGIYSIVQNETWQRSKTEVGMTFYFNQEENSTACDIFDDNILVNFGATDDLDPTADVSNDIAIPVVIQEWISSTTGQIIEAGGFVQLVINDVYNDTNDLVNAPVDAMIIAKPSFGEFIIAVNSGSNCPGGLIVNSAWGMIQKSADGLEETSKTMNFFVQTERQWPSNDLGFIYGYNPQECPDRSGITAEIILDTSIVNTIFDADDIPSIY